MTLSRVPWLFSCSGSGVLNVRYSKKLMLNGGSRVYNLLSLVMYPKCVYFASLTLTSEYWGGVRTAHAPEQGHNHNLDNVALNNACSVS
jgi:hypothetical protein